MYKAIIFDMDGTLIRTPLPYIRKTLELTLRKFNKKINVKKYEARRFWYKEGKGKYIKDHFGVEDIDLFWKEFIKTDSPERRGRIISIYSDVSHLWKFKENYRLRYGILTNAHPDITKIELDLLGGDLVDIVVNGHPNNDILPKPSPQGADYILNKLGVSPKEGIFIGDSEIDMVCAKAVPMKGVLIDRNEHKVTVDAEKLVDLYDIRLFLEDVY